MADQLIGYGEFDVVVAGGMESMTQGPYLLPKARGGYRYGDGEIVDSTAHDALFCSFDQLGMGAATETYTQAAWHQPGGTGRLLRWIAWPGRRGAEERPVRRRDRGGGGAAAQGRPMMVTEDEGVRPDTTAATLAKLRPGVRRGRHGDRRLVVADLRRRRSRGGDVAGQGRGAGAADPGGDRRARHGRRAGPVAAVPASQRRSARRWTGESHA